VTPETILAETAKPAREQAEAAVAPPPANEARKSAIVTIRRKPDRILPPGLLPETPEEHKRRGDGADAMFQRFKRLIEEAVAKEKPKALLLRPIRRQRRP
jgi:hypothetical protein